MNRKKPRFPLCNGKSKFALTFSLLIAVALPAIGSSLTLPFPEIGILKGKTASGHPYMVGGISSDEQRVMERAARPYNLKLVFARRAGTPTTPDFLIIGANNGRGMEKIALRAPWFYIQLPTGGYTIMARFGNQVVLLKDVSVQEDRLRWYLLRGD